MKLIEATIHLNPERIDEETIETLMLYASNALFRHGVMSVGGRHDGPIARVRISCPLDKRPVLTRFIDSQREHFEEYAPYYVAYKETWVEDY